MELIDRYVYHVGQNLPYKQRADIETEIRSLLEDALEARSQELGRPADEGMAAGVLKEFGSPEKVASSYLPERYLIGPRLYPIFTLVMRIVLAVIGTLAVFGLVFKASQQPPAGAEFLPALGSTLANFFSTALQVLGNLVVVFWVLERVVPQAGAEKEGDWDPRKLEPAGDTEHIKPVGTIMEIVLSVAAILFFNLGPGEFGRVLNFSDGVLVIVPVLSAAFYRLLPALTALWAMEILKNIWLLRRGKWDTATRWADLALNAAGLGLLLVLLLGGPLVSIPAAGALNEHTAQLVEKGIDTGLKVALAVGFAVTAVEIATMIYRLFSRPTTPVT